MTLRILADENMPREAVEALRRLGNDVLWARTSAPGRTDEALLAQAQAEGRIVVTFDKDFGELAFQRGLPASSGVILFRLETRDSEQASAFILSAVNSRSDWAGHFSVVERERIRMTPFRKARSEPHEDNGTG